MKKRAFTLVEIIITVFFISIITISLFPLLFSEMNRLNAAFNFTKAGFDAQTKIEGEIYNLTAIEAENFSSTDTTAERIEKEQKFNELANWSDGGSELSIDLFGVNNIPVLSKTMKTDKKDIGTGKDYARDVLVVLPKSKGFKVNSPEIKVSISGSGDKYGASVSYLTNSLTGKSWKEEIDFCVYRWYIGEYTGSKPDVSKLTVIREFNLAKNNSKPKLFEKATQFKYKLKGDVEDLVISNGVESFKLIADGPHVYIDGTPPLVVDGISKTDGDNIDIVRLNGIKDSSQDFTSREKTALYGAKGLVFSAMPVTKAGLVGKETFSRMVNLEIPQERLQLGITSTPEYDPPNGAYRVKFLIKQVDNNEHGHLYKFEIKDLRNSKTYYPFLTHFGYYVLREDPKTFSVPIETDINGNGDFMVLLRPSGNYEISIKDENNIVMQAEINIIAAP